MLQKLKLILLMCLVICLFCQVQFHESQLALHVGAPLFGEGQLVSAQDGVAGLWKGLGGSRGSIVDHLGLPAGGGRVRMKVVGQIEVLHHVVLFDLPLSGSQGLLNRPQLQDLIVRL